MFLLDIMCKLCDEGKLKSMGTQRRPNPAWGQEDFPEEVMPSRDMKDGVLGKRQRVIQARGAQAWGQESPGYDL